MKSLPEIKRGDTFNVKCIYKGDNIPTSINGYTVTSQIRTWASRLVQSATVTIADQTTNPGLFYLSATAADTSNAWRPAIPSVSITVGKINQ